MIADVSIIPSLSKFRNLFNKPCFAHFVRYIHGLVVSDRKTINSINNDFMNRKNQSSLNRFLTRYKWSKDKLNELRLKEFLTKRNGGVLILDDSPIEKTGKRIEGVGYLFDHTQNKNILGHNIVSTHYVNGNQTPMHFELYQKKETAKNFKTKIEIGIELIKKALDIINPSIILFDAWYLCEKLTRALKGKKWVSRAKLNRLVKYKGKWISVKKLASKLKNFRKFDVEISDERYDLITSVTTKMKGIGKVKLVLLKNSLSGSIVAIATNSNYGDETIVMLNKKRSAIETFYRDCKQNLGLGKYQLRKLDAIVKHLWLVFLAYSLLRDSGLLNSLSEFVEHKIETIGECCRAVKGKIVGKFVEWSIGLYEKVGDIGMVVKTAIEGLY